MSRPMRVTRRGMAVACLTGALIGLPAGCLTVPDRPAHEVMR